MNTTRTERVCVTCPGLGRDGQDDRPAPNYYDYQHACEECRPQLRGILNRAPRAFALLDATPTTGRHQHVSGTKDAPLGVRIAVLDELVGRPAIALVAPPLPDGPDQEGNLSTARILAHIATAWLPHRGAWERLPEHATVTTLAAWLEHRIDWACDTLPHLMGDHDDQPGHARILGALSRRLDRLNDPGTSKPEAIKYVPCPECDRYTLIRLGDEVLCTGTNCTCRLTGTQYENWSKLTAEAAKQAA